MQKRVENLKSIEINAHNLKGGSFFSLHSGDSWMYPYQRTPMGNPYISPISTMGTLLGVHPIVP